MEGKKKHVENNNFVFRKLFLIFNFSVDVMNAIKLSCK